MRVLSLTMDAGSPKALVPFRHTGAIVSNEHAHDLFAGSG